VDSRRLDAHAHPGKFVFDHPLRGAIRHCEAGLRTSEPSLRDDCNGVLPWGLLIDNRPFLHCIYGYGLRLRRVMWFDEAEYRFQQMLRLNTPDNQVVRCLIDEVKAKTAWEDRENE
jgi:hypothetical protein